MKLLIVDDEPPARERLRRLLAEIEDCEVIAEAGNGEEALSRCGELRPDVVLLDVRMPGLSGIQIARHIDTLEDPPAVIFTTAYDQYAVEAFETEAVGYLLKPVRKEKLAHALRHAARISPSRLVKVAESARIEHRRDQICARLGEQLRLIPIADIYYFLADQKYVTVKHRGGESLIDESLKTLGRGIRSGLRAHPSQRADRGEADLGSGAHRLGSVRRASARVRRRARGQPPSCVGAAATDSRRNLSS